MVAILTKGLQKSFGSNVVLNGVDLEVPEGAIYAILGRNGAGKSTFINVLTGSMVKTGGEFELLGAASDKLDQTKPSMGVMPDASDMYGNMSGKRFLKYMGELKGVKLSDDDVKQLMGRVYLSCPPERKLKQYSFGMRKKIGIAQSLIGDPKLLFLDEPTSGVDPESALRLQELFKLLNAAGTTIFMASHNMEEVRQCCTHMCILDEGKIVVSGAIDDIVAEHTGVYRVKVECELPADYDAKAQNPEYAFDEIAEGHFVVELLKRENTPGFVSKLVSDGIKIYGVEEVRISLEAIFLGEE